MEVDPTKTLPSPTPTDPVIVAVETAPQSEASVETAAVPSDIQHILSLGASEEDLTPLSEYEQVVKDLKMHVGLGEVKTEGEGVEEEMEARGAGRSEVMRSEEEQQLEGEDMQETGEVKEEVIVQVMQEEKEGEMLPPPVPSIAGAATISQDSQVTMAEDSDSSSASSSSSDDSSSDSDSDSSSEVASTLLSLPRSSRPRNRGKRNKNPSTSNKPSFSDDDEEVHGPSTSSAPKTEHEINPDAMLVLPEMEKIDEEYEINKFGKVESVIENVVVVKADTGGDWRVLDEGTVVCWEDRVVAGTIFETFGSVLLPFYSLRFHSSHPPSPSIFTPNRPIFYAPKMAKYIFTRDIRNIKGSDASNLFDEEIGEEEGEWSDDEKEAEFKKARKANKRNQRQSATPGPSSSRASSVVPPSTALPHPSHLPARPLLSYEDALPSASSSSSSSRPLIGELPPRGNIGRKMFERDGGEDDGEGMFEFSDGDGPDEEDDESERGSEMGDVNERRTHGQGGGQGGRGGNNGRGRGRGGARGGGGGNDRGRGRGGARGGRGRGGAPQGQGERRPVAALPNRATPPTSTTTAPGGLPSRPDFNPQIPSSASPVMANASVGAGEERGSGQGERGYQGYHPAQGQGYGGYGGGGGGGYPQHQQQHHQQQQGYGASPAAAYGYQYPRYPQSQYQGQGGQGGYWGGGGGGFGGGGGYPQHQQQQGYGQGGFDYSSWYANGGMQNGRGWNGQGQGQGGYQGQGQGQGEQGR